MDNERTLHFTLGPVQGFIARARRTRDLWAGSFLLSYLAGHAMYRVIREKREQGKIIFPAVTDGEKITDDLLQAIARVAEQKTPEKHPQVGTLPNRFQARVPAGFDPRECTLAVQTAWERIAGAVWDKYVAPVANKGAGTEEIWRRQIENFWEMNWAVGEDNNCLDRRKNWRSHVPPIEYGDKCTLMGNLQELSGYLRARKKERKKQDLFWKELRDKAGELNIKEGERLCAVSLVKRLFPLVAEEAVGWPVRRGYPSTSYIAAVPWLIDTMDKDADRAGKFLLLARQDEKLKNNIHMEKESNISSIEKAKQEHPQIAGFAECDGNFFYASTLANDNLWPEGTGDKRLELRQQQKKFKSEPSTFYAVLAVDGDRLGALLQKAGKEVVSGALAGFAGKVPGIVDNHNGVLVYAGGDDVLALVPARDAVALATDLRLQYKRAFEDTGIDDHLATVSAAVVYAHHHAPLKAVLGEAHTLLDEVAKDHTGRDSLAVRVWNTGGPGLLWSAPWETILESGSNLLDSLVKDFAGGTAGEKQYNSAFFYNLRCRFSLFWNKTARPELENLDLTDLFLAEYLRSRGRENIDRDEARRRMERLLKICRKFRRVSPGNGEKPHIIPDGISMDGAILVRFLAEKGGIRDEQTVEV